MLPPVGKLLRATTSQCGGGNPEQCSSLGQIVATLWEEVGGKMRLETSTQSVSIWLAHKNREHQEQSWDRLPGLERLLCLWQH